MNKKFFYILIFIIIVISSFPNVHSINKELCENVNLLKSIDSECYHGFDGEDKKINNHFFYNYNEKQQKNTTNLQYIIGNGGPNKIWDKTYGNNHNNVFYDIYITSENEILTCGHTRVLANDGIIDLDGWVMKIDENGNELWNNTYGGLRSDTLEGIHQTIDGQFILSGWTSSYSSNNNDIWIVKIDENGHEQWNKTYGGENTEFCMSHVIETNDGGLIFLGYSDSNMDNIGNLWVVKTDAQGNQEWNKTFGGSNMDLGMDLIKTNDNGFLLLGNTNSYGMGNQDGWIIKIDDNGLEEWNTTIGDMFYNQVREIIQTNDNEFIIIGFSEYTIEASYDYFYLDYDLWLCKIDNQGQLLWETTIGDRFYNEIPNSISKTQDNGLLISGFRQSLSNNQADAYLVKIDNHYQIEWKKIIESENNQATFQAASLFNDGYICCGFKTREHYDDHDGWVLTLSTFENNPPFKPTKPNGNPRNKIFSSSDYSSISEDPDNHQIFYLFNWGDGYDSGWLGPYNSGEECITSYFWTEPNNYEVKVKVKDIHGGESDWSDPLPLQIPKKVIMKNWFILRLYEQVTFLDIIQFLFKALEGYQ